MKIRQDFVTNSSSSSFILSFNNAEEVQNFAESCNEFGYEEFFHLVENLVNSGNTDKETCLSWLHSYYAAEVMDELMEKYVSRDDPDYYSKRNEIEKTEEFKMELESRLDETDYPKKVDEVLNADFVIHGMIWDSNGGMLEWAIRNGFIQDCFRKYCTLCWNIG